MAGAGGEALAAATAVVTVRDLDLRFGEVAALTSVGFSVGAGELFAVIGPNGAGKSSLFNVLTGSYRPTRGSVELMGCDLAQMRTDQLAGRGVARSYQNLGLFRGLSVIENLLVGRHHMMHGGVLSGGLAMPRTRRDEKRHRAAAMGVLERFDLADLAHRAVEELAYGVQKRVELARCMAAEPRLLLLDEPVAGMSEGERAVVTEAIEELHATTETTIVLVEHDMGMVMSVAERVLVLDFGQVIAQGTPTQVQQDPTVIRAYLGEEMESLT